jgi:nucleoid DNA-binding protein
VKKLDVSDQTANELIEGLLELMKLDLNQGKAIKIPGFGNFSVQEK